MTLLKDPSSTTMNSLDNSEDPFNYVPLGAAAKRRKKRRDSPQSIFPSKAQEELKPSSQEQEQRREIPSLSGLWNALELSQEL
ncbi:Hypothetical protein FKW44_023011 [Caligus rogercresseyi]|uniref:Uncharacterized protein n=1 Tax=Caligus rogercresseyi TaxID=217165 RepID=A0A7T8GNC9_CALRO|nr:Hypothetical protein FKW44_023011 [Caligus rogercresseyi]